MKPRRFVLLACLAVQLQSTHGAPVGPLSTAGPLHGPVVPVQLMAAGSEYETPLYELTHFTGRNILIVAGMHGDEPAGVEAARRLLDTLTTLRRAGSGPPGGREQSGALFILPAANIPALREGRRRGEWAPDLNRVFPGRLDTGPLERLAHEIFALIEQRGIEIVVDLHETAPGSSDHEELRQALVFTTGPVGAADLVFDLKEALDGLFTAVTGAPSGSLNRETALRRGVISLSVETSTDLPFEGRVELQLAVLRKILDIK